MTTITHFPLPTFIDKTTSNQLIEKVEQHLSNLKLQQVAIGILEIFQMFPQIKSISIDKVYAFSEVKLIEDISEEEGAKLGYNIGNYIEQYRSENYHFIKSLAEYELNRKNIESYIRKEMGEKEFDLWQAQLKASEEKKLLEQNLEAKTPTSSIKL